MPTTILAPKPAVPTAAAPHACLIAEQALSAAYSDCHPHHSGSRVPERNLNFCCPVTVSLEEAWRLLRRYVPGYNAFKPRLLKALPQNCRVRFAREGSVCLYVETAEASYMVEAERDLHCDEFELCQVLGTVRTYRLWWE